MTEAGISYRSGSAWLVVYTDARAEKDVAYEIWNAGFDVFLPLARIRGKPGKPNRSEPLYRRYILAGVDLHRCDWGALKHLDGVCGVICGGDGEPSRVPQAFVRALMKAEAYGGFDYTVKSPSLFAVGETVRIGEGKFSGFNAIIQEFVAKMKSTTAAKRAKVLIEFMGRMSAVEIDLTALEKA